MAVGTQPSTSKIPGPVVDNGGVLAPDAATDGIDGVVPEAPPVATMSAVGEPPPANATDDRGDANAGPVERPGPVQLLRTMPNLRRLWFAQTWAGVGEALARIAMPLFVYDLTDSTTAIGFVAFAQILPRVLLSPIAGLLVDRVDRRRLLILADAERLGLVALLPFATEVWHVVVLAVGIALGNAVARPAELAAVPALAGPDRLVGALSLFQVTGGVINIAIPAAGAAVLATTGPKAAFWLQAACFLGSLLALRTLRIPRAPDAPGVDRSGGLVARAKREMWAGLAATVRHPIVRGVTAVESLWQVAGAALVVAGVLYTEETLDLGNRAESAFALMTASMAAGAVLGALVASRVEARLGRPRLMAIGYTGPFFLMVFLFEPSMPVVYAALFAFGLADAWAVIAFQAYLAEAIPDGQRGRVYAAFGAIVMGTSALAFAVAGPTMPWLGAPRSFGLAGAVVGAGGPLLLWWTGALRAMRHHRPVETGGGR